MKKTNKILLILILFFFSTIIINAEEITFSANKMTGSTGENSEYTKLTGKAFIQTDTLEINADEVVLSGKDFRFISAKGNISGKNTKSAFDFTCQQLEYDRDTKLATLKGNVTMIDKDNDVTATAQIIEYDQETEIAFMQINVKLIQKKNTCTGANAIYKKAEQTLELSGSPKILKDKDTFKANEIFMNLDTEEIVLDGKVRGSVTDSSSSNAETKEQEKPTSQAKPADKANPATPTSSDNPAEKENTNDKSKDEKNIPEENINTENTETPVVTEQQNESEVKTDE